MESENENKPPLDENTQNKINEIIWQAATQQEVEDELRTQQRFVDFFKGYQPYSVENFIKSYAWLKPFIVQNGPSWLQQQEGERLQWINSATQHLSIIQQKKLFDAQCLWRAEQLHIPEIEITFDFTIWGKKRTPMPIYRACY